MSEKPSEKTQTTPAGKEIPVPLRSQVLGDLKKIAKDHIVRKTSTKQ